MCCSSYHPNFSKIFMFLVIAFSAFQTTEQVRSSVPLSLVQNIYISTGNFRIVPNTMSSYITYYTIAYQKAKPTVVDSVNFYVSFQGIDFKNNPLLTWSPNQGHVSHFQVAVTSSTTSSFQLKILVNGYIYGNHLNVGYLIIDNEFPLSSFIYHKYFTISSLPGIATQTLPTFSVATNLIICSFLTFINLWKQDSMANPFNTGIILQIDHNATHLAVNVTYAQTPFYSKSIQVQVMAAFVPSSQAYQMQVFQTIEVFSTVNYFQVALANLDYEKSKYLMGIIYFTLLRPSSYADNSRLASLSFDGGLSYPNIASSTFSPSFTSFAYSFAYINFYDCGDTNYPFKGYNQSSGQFQCYSKCEISEYETFIINTGNYTQTQCEACFYTCLTCKQVVLCDSCDQINHHRYLTGSGQCLSLTGYFNQINITLAAQCSSICFECQGVSTNCTSCNSTAGLFLFSSTCAQCSTYIQYCIQCINQSVCLKCESGTQLVYQYLCQLINAIVPPPVVCTDANCSKCNPINLDYCIICVDLLITPTSGLCIVFCGDGKTILPEECDDGNLQNFDGCSAECILQQHFICNEVTINSSITTTSLCRYNQTIEVNFQELQKLKQGNLLTVYFRLMNPIIRAWSIIQNNGGLLSMFRLQQNNQTHSEIKLVSAQFVPDYLNKSSFSYNGSRRLQSFAAQYYIQRYSYCQVTFKYLKNLNQTLKLWFQPSLDSSSEMLSDVPSIGINFSPLNSLNNLKVLYYSNQIYQISSFLQKVCSTMGIIVVSLFMISLFFGNKLIAIEAASLMQITYFSVISIGQLNPTFSCLKYLKMATGYNVEIQYSIRQQMFETTNQSIRNILGMDLNIQIVDNFNISFMLMIITLVISLFMFIMSKIFKCLKSQQKQNKLLDLAKHTFGSITLAIIVFNCYLLTSSIIIQLQFGFDQEFNPISVAIGITSLIILLVYLIIILISIKMSQLKQPFSDITKKIKNKKWKESHFLILIIEKSLSSIILMKMVNFLYQQTLIISIFILVIIYSIKFKLHSIANTIRTVSNCIIIILIQLCIMYQKVMNSLLIQQSEYEMSINLPITIVMLLALSLIVNFIFFVYSIPKLRCCILQLDKTKNNQKKEKYAKNYKSQSKNFEGEQIQINEFDQLFHDESQKLNIHYRKNKSNGQIQNIRNNLLFCQNNEDNQIQQIEDLNKNKIDNKTIRKQIQKHKINSKQKSNIACKQKIDKNYIFKNKQFDNKQKVEQQTQNNDQNGYKYTGKIYFTLEEYDQI